MSEDEESRSCEAAISLIAELAESRQPFESSEIKAIDSAQRKVEI